MPIAISTDSRTFLSAVQPYLEAKDAPALCAFVRRHYSNDQLCGMLGRSDMDVCKVAALALGMVGDRHCIPCLVDQLRNSDPVINQMAEHALWNVWFRGGSPEANQELCRGTRCLSEREFEGAFVHFGRALKINPDFAEVFHQRGIAWSVLENDDKAIADYRRSVELMPSHFCAWAGLGHAYAMRERLPEAIDAYEKAREINPHLEGITQAIGGLRRLAVQRAGRTA